MVLGSPAPSLVDIQSDRPELPSLKTFQSEENVSCVREECGEMRVVQSRHRQRGELSQMRSHRSLDLDGETQPGTNKQALQMMRAFKSVDHSNPEA